MPSKSDVICPLHEDFEKRVDSLEECLTGIKDNALKSARMGIWTLISILFGMISFFAAQVYFHVNSGQITQVQIEKIIQTTIEKSKK